MKLNESVFSYLLLASSLALAEVVGAGEPIGEIQEFYQDLTKCYCSEDKKNGLKINSKDLTKVLRESSFGMSILGCGHKQLVQISLPAAALEPSIVSAEARQKSCYATAKTDAGNSYACWIKATYIQHDAQCDETGFAGDPNADERPLCKDLGGVIGAGKCEKKK